MQEVSRSYDQAEGERQAGGPTDQKRYTSQVHT